MITFVHMYENIKRLISSKSSNGQLLVASVVLGLLTLLAFKSVITHPNKFLVAGGDGMKNYYTFMYHVKHDSSYWHFEGMNYPFGEHITFTDNQPLLVNITKALYPIFPNLGCHLPAVHNLAMVLGFWIGCFGIFLVLRKLGIDFVFSLFAAAAIGLIHPQMERFHAHFAMFYPLLPWIFYHLIDIWRDKSFVKPSIYIALIITVGGLLHMYHFITCGILCLLAGVSLLWTNKEKNSKFTSIITFIGIQVIVPFIILTAITSLIHPIADRPNNPWGFFSYHSYPEGLLFSYRMPLFHFINNSIIKIRDFDMEGKSYLGLIAVIYILWMICSHYRVWTWTRQGIINLWQSENGRFGFIAIASALISFGLPFTIDGLEGLLQFTGPFKQFRSIGRVSWVSFYAFNFLAIPYVYKRIIQNDDVQKRWIIYASVLGVMVSEAWFFKKEKPINQSEISAYTCGDLAPLPFNRNDYQALLPDPYFSAGSECFSWWDQGSNVSQNFELSYRLGIPTIGGNMSRTSFSQSRILNELTNDPIKVPELIQILKKKDSRPLLVVESKKDDIHEPRAKLTHWTKDAPIVFENADYRLRKLTLSSFDTIVAKELSILAPTSMAGPKAKLTLQKTKGYEGWGYENAIKVDSSFTGQRKVGYWIDAPNADKVCAITQIWLFDGSDKVIHHVGEANRFNYTQYGEGTKMFISTPIDMKPGSVKMVIRVSIDNQKEKDVLDIGEVVVK